MQHWLITYSQNTGAQVKTVNKVIDTHPADWLLDALQKYPDADTVLINAIKIMGWQYLELREHL